MSIPKTHKLALVFAAATFTACISETINPVISGQISGDAVTRADVVAAFDDVTSELGLKKVVSYDGPLFVVEYSEDHGPATPKIVMTQFPESEEIGFYFYPDEVRNVDQLFCSRLLPQLRALGEVNFNMVDIGMMNECPSN